MVKSARHVFTGERVAVKVIDKMKLDAATQVNSEVIGLPGGHVQCSSSNSLVSDP